jgi:hypothetical protein
MQFTNTEGLKIAFDGLRDIFPVLEKEPVYSTGFIRYSKLSKKQLTRVYMQLKLEGSNLISRLQNQTFDELFA